MFGYSPMKTIDVSGRQPTVSYAQRELSSRVVPIRQQHQHRELEWRPKAMLDAPRIVDDFYYNILGWSKKNILAIALSKHTYLRNMGTNVTKKIAGTAKISSIGFDEDAEILCIANSEKLVYFVDVKQTQMIQGVSLSRQVLSLSWNGAITSLGCYGGRISLN